MVVEWGELLGRTPSDALRLAHAVGLLPSAPRRAGTSKGFSIKIGECFANEFLVCRRSTGQLANFGHTLFSRHARETPRDRRSQMFFSHFAILASKYVLAIALLQGRLSKPSPTRTRLPSEAPFARFGV